MMQISQDLYDRTYAFVRTMAATCRNCMRPKSACDDCDLFQARFLVESLQDGRQPIDRRRVRINAPSFRERCEYYTEAIAAAGRPLSARAIDPHNKICARGLKYWTLRKMVKKGLLKTYCDGKTMFFSTPNTHKEQANGNENQNHGGKPTDNRGRDAGTAKGPHVVAKCPHKADGRPGADACPEGQGQGPHA